MDIATMEAQRLDWTNKARALYDAADNGKREMTVEEDRNWQDYMAHAKQLAARIKAEQEMRAQEEVRNTSFEKPTKPELDKAVTEPAQRRVFRSFGEQMRAVLVASQPGGYVDPRLIEMRAPTGMGEGVGSDGGFLVQTDFATTLLQNVFAQGTVAEKCRRLSLSSGANQITLPAVDETSRVDGSRAGGVAAAWTAEAGAKTASQPHIREINIKLNKLTALGYATDELLADASALEGFLMQSFTDEIRWRLDNAIIRGDGAGKPLGILAAPCLVTVAAEGGQPATTVVAENLMNMYARMYAPSRQNAYWFINQDVEVQLMQMSLAVGGGGQLVYMPAGGLSGSPYGSLFGRPVVPIEQCSTLGTVGDVIFADMSQYLLVDKGGIQSASSIHVRFVNDESTFRFVYRVGGQPWWSSALTPANGTNTLSPFVALATRS